MADLTDEIEAMATDGVQEAAADGRSVKAVPLPDLIAADKYLADKDAAASGKGALGRTIRIQRAIPPGAGPC